VRGLLAALPHAIQRDGERLAYRVYVTDALRALCGGGARYWELVRPQPEPAETRTPEEIIERVGAVFRGGGG